MPARTKIAFKHILEYSRPNPDQITYKNIYFYMKIDENRENSIKMLKIIKIVAKAKLGI